MTPEHKQLVASGRAQSKADALQLDSDPKTWPYWYDLLGQRFEVGDNVAVAVVNNKSPQMVLGRVVRINRLNYYGQPIMGERLLHAEDGADGQEKGFLLVSFESATVTVEVQRDSRFTRWGNRVGNKHLVTYRFPENIIKIP